MIKFIFKIILEIVNLVIKIKWKNRKTGNTYYALAKTIEATNSRDGQISILYTDLKKLYVREGDEFESKFEKYEKHNNIP